MSKPALRLIADPGGAEPRPWLATFLERRGYHVAYRQGEVNHCPGCGRSSWLVGRQSAECGFCGTAVPFRGAE